jgi:hypothetical protein
MSLNLVRFADHFCDFNSRLFAYVQTTSGAAPIDLASFPAAAKLQQLLNTPQAQLEQMHSMPSSSRDNDSGANN